MHLFDAFQAERLYVLLCSTSGVLFTYKFASDDHFEDTSTLLAFWRIQPGKEIDKFGTEYASILKCPFNKVLWCSSNSKESRHFHSCVELLGLRGTKLKPAKYRQISTQVYKQT